VGTHRSRLPLAIAAAVLAAGVATVVLRPRSGLIDPAAIDAKAYFSADELQRVEDFRGLQRVLGLGGIALGGVTVALLALRPPRRVRRALERAGRRPLLGGAAVAAGIALTVTVVELPLSAWRHERAVDVGLSTQSLGPWLADVAKASAVSAVYAAVGGLLLMALVRRFPRNWWAPGALLVVGVATATLYLQPILVDPLFNRFDPLPRGELRSEVLRLADRAGVDVGEVYRVDASRRTSAVNAYVGGLGHTKRVVLYDNLIDDYPPGQVRSVVAHELGHVKHGDVPRGLLWIAIVAPAGTFLIQRLAERFSSGALDGPGRPLPSALPAVVLAFALVSFAMTSAGNLLSRQIEARADAFALELIDDPRSFIELERSLALRNLGDPDPPALLHALFGTHPTTVERIGYGVAAKSEASDGEP
jgi:STE24 endopeptidase